MKKTLLLAPAIAAALLYACASDDQPVTNAPDAAANDATTATDTAPITDAGADIQEKPDTSIPRPPFDASAPEITCAVTPCMKALRSGSSNYCAIDDIGIAHCWGQPYAIGSFADAGTSYVSTPVALTGLGPVTDIGVSDYDTCAIVSDGGVTCFGLDSQQQMPEAVPNVGIAVKLGIGNDRRCAVTKNGDMNCWGQNFATGQDAGTTTLPEQVVDVNMRFTVGVALGQKGTVYTWGEERNMLGRTSALQPDLSPAPVIGMPSAIQMASSDSHICALAGDGRLFCWGRDDQGELGLGYIRAESFPVEVPFGTTAWPTQVAGAISHSCARMSDGSLTCWASANWSGQLGYPSMDGVYQPTTVASVTKKVAYVAVGNNSTCVLLTDGSVQCFGDNSQGQLGRGTQDTIRHPDPETVVFP